LSEPDEIELEIAKAALAVSRESLQKQQADVRELRVVAGMLLTGTSVAASFLGGRALDSGQLIGLPGLGLGALVGSLFAIIRVLLPGLPFDPEKRLKETSRGAEILGLRDPDATGPDARHDLYVIGRLAATYDLIYANNDGPIRALGRYLWLASVLLVLQVAAWGASIGLAKPDPVSCTPATIGGSRGCLARGQRCDRRNQAEYERFGFVCTRRAGDGLARLR
jgi:hypothetical protein